MYEINWNRFALKNPDAQTAFETMCRNLFLRKYKIGAYDFSSNFNQTGIEIEPILHDKKTYGFQCKYSSSGNSNAFYQELFDSLDKAAKTYSALNTLIVYTNLDIKPNPTLAEQEKSKKSKRIKIFELAEDKNIQIKWICKNNFEQILNEISNLDLYRLYFSSQDELGFLSSSLTAAERTFLDSNQFLDLPINNCRFSQIQEELMISSFSVLTGAAGTGKSEIQKKIFLDYEKNFLSSLESGTAATNVPIPVFIRLRDCVNGNLEDLLRNRLKDYAITATDASRSFVYFFDGIDEVNSIDFNVISACFMRLSKKQSTKSIVLSSRTNTSNLTTIYREFEPKTFLIGNLRLEDIESYFEHGNDIKKKEEFEQIKQSHFSILNDITDIFSTALLWENIGKIEKTTTKVDLISLSVYALIDRSRKLSVLNLPEPKVACIDMILSDVSEEMQRSNHINISRTNFQKIVHNIFPNASYKEIDMTIDYICEIFFDTSSSLRSKLTYSYRHKRYFEFYLYRMVKKVFYKEPAILRELHLLSNKDFMLNIFLIQELKDNTENEDMHKVLVLRFLEAYLGDEYICKSKSPWFTQRSNFSGGSESYLESRQLRDYLCSKEMEDLYTFLKNDPLSLSSFLKSDNLWSFVKCYHEVNRKDIRPLLDDVFKLDDSWKKEAVSKDLGAYWYCKCVMDNAPVELIYDKIKKLDYKNIESDLDYVSGFSHNNITIAVAFFEMAIELFPEWTLSNIEVFTIEQLEIICFVFLKTNAIKVLFSENKKFANLRSEICKRVDSNKKDFYKINTIVLYNLLTNQIIHKESVDARIKKSNVHHYGTWEHNLDLNCYAAVLLKDTFHAAHSGFLLGISIRQILTENYPARKELILDMILQEIKKYNLVYDNWFSYNNSLIIGEFLGTLEFETTTIKQFVRELLKYQSVISLFTVFYRVMQKNRILFKVIANQRLVASAYDYANRSISYYDSNSDIGFMYATMMSCFDLANGEAQFENALNNSIFRPIFRKEDIIDYYLPQCLLMAYNNNWLSTSELQNAIDRVHEMLKISQDTLDSGAYFDYFKFLIETCFHDSPLLSDMYSCTSRNPCDREPWADSVHDVRMESLTIDDLPKYYACEIDGVDYSSISVWRTLIEFEYKYDAKLQSLYATLDKSYFPAQRISKSNACFHIIIAILTTSAETKDEAIRYVMNCGGRTGLVNMIRAFSLTGNDGSARQYIESLLGLCEALVYPNMEQITAYREKQFHTTNVIDIVCNSSRSQWSIEEENNRMFFNKDPKVSIVWDEVDHDELFHEEWATQHPDSQAHKVNYRLYYENNIVDTFYLVHVDGFRALVPMPDYQTQRIKRKDYQFGQLLTDSIKNYNEYIIRSGLSVE